jgi:hypothetical protein
VGIGHRGRALDARDARLCRIPHRRRVALMYAGGQYLEASPSVIPSHEMTALLARGQRDAYEHDATEVSLDAIEPGDRLVIRKGRGPSRRDSSWRRPS